MPRSPHRPGPQLALAAALGALANAPALLALLALLAAACSDGRTAVHDSDQPADEGPGITSGTGDPVIPGTPPGATDPDGVNDSTSDDETAGFVMTNDWGVAYECDLFAQDCRPGEKCMPWATNGGPAWNGTRCSPIAEDPGQEGDPCTVVGSAVSGVDDCGLGLMCWWVDETGAGTCEDLCTGSADNPICDDPNEVCPISATSVIILCLDRCDPLAQDCADDAVCYPVKDDWLCGPDTSGEAGAYGDPCEYQGACDEGYVCLGSQAFTNCASAIGCCSVLCNVDDGTADAACAALDPGQTCEPWYIEGMAPAGYESLGVCALPA